MIGPGIHHVRKSLRTCSAKDCFALSDIFWLISNCKCGIALCSSEFIFWPRQKQTQRPYQKIENLEGVKDHSINIFWEARKHKLSVFGAANDNAGGSGLIALHSVAPTDFNKRIVSLWPCCITSPKAVKPCSPLALGSALFRKSFLTISV